MVQYYKAANSSIPLLIFSLQLRGISLVLYLMPYTGHFNISPIFFPLRATAFWKCLLERQNYFFAVLDRSLYYGNIMETYSLLFYKSQWYS